MARTTVTDPNTLELVRAFGRAVASRDAIFAEQDRGNMRRGPLAYSDAVDGVRQALDALRAYCGDDYAKGVADGLNWGRCE